MSQFIKKNHHLLLLALIFIVAIFFRTYQLIPRLEFGHDADLYSWVVKDIVVNHHPRLIGQLTTADGIFIGPFFYYLLIPFFILTNMDPVGAIIPTISIGLLTIISFYFCLSKLFNKQVALIAAFLQAVLLKIVYFDRWAVPTIPTYLWAIWYLFVLLQITKGNYKHLFILGILLGFIWHIHIALIPTLLALPIAFYFSKKLPDRKNILLFLLSLVLTSLPLIIFEFRHNFSQSQSFFQNFTSNHGGGNGLDKLNLVLVYLGNNLNSLFIYQKITLPFINNQMIAVAFLFIGMFLPRYKLITFKELFVLYAWVLGTIFFFSASSSPISEYYFANNEVVIILFIALLLYKLFLSKQLFYRLAFFCLIISIFLYNLIYLVSHDVYHKGYVEKKAVANFITQDAIKKNYPCVAVSYITPLGEGVGFRYFFYLNNLHVNQPSSGSPVYSIVIPSERAWGQNEIEFGKIKIIPPDKKYSDEDLQKSCSGQNSNLTDSMFGYTE